MSSDPEQSTDSTHNVLRIASVASWVDGEKDGLGVASFVLANMADPNVLAFGFVSGDLAVGQASNVRSHGNSGRTGSCSWRDLNVGMELRRVDRSGSKERYSRATRVATSGYLGALMESASIHHGPHQRLPKGLTIL